jgi:hypothetical protein
MKTLKIFAVLCFFVVFPSTKAFSQVTRGSFDWYFTFNAGDCLDEDVSGTITVQQLWNNNHYQEKGRGTLTGSTSGDDYTLTFEYNAGGHAGINMLTGGFTFPMLLFHEGKLVMIIHESYRGVELTENYWTGPFIVDRYVYSVECK